MTVNDLDANQLLVRIAQLQPIVSAHIRSGDLSKAAWATADLTAVVRELEWRIRDLIKEAQ